MSITLVAIDDHPIVVEGLAIVLAREDIEVTWLGSHTTWAAFQEWLATSGVIPEVVLLDLNLGDGVDPCSRIREVGALGCRVVVITSELRPVPIRRAVQAGAVGLVLKSDPARQVAEVLRDVSDGNVAVSSDLAFALINDEHLIPNLAPRELEALRLMADGVPRKSIGRHMDPPVALSTVVTYLNRACARYEALGRPVGTPQSVIRAATRDGYL